MGNKLIAVTGFWDPAGLGRSAFRSADVYLRLFADLHRAVPYPMVIFIDPSLRDRLEALLAASPASAERVVIERRFDELRFGRDLSKKSFRKLRPPENGAAHKDTHAFAIVTWAKTDLLAEAASMRSDATHAMWLDFGVAHIGSLRGVEWSAIEQACPEMPRICEMRAVSPAELADRCEYYRFLRGKIASGMFTVGRPRVKDLQSKMHAETDRMLATGRISLEEAVFGAIAGEEPETFSRWFSDYQGVVANYTIIQYNPHCVLDNLTFCREHSLHARGVEVARELIRAMQQDAVRLHPVDAARLLHEALICAFYVDRPYAEELADRITALYTFAASTRGYFDADLVRSNIGFLGRTLDKPNLSWDQFAATEDFSAWKSTL